MYTKKTLRKLSPKTRELARTINTLELEVKRLKRFLEAVERMELDSKALFSRQAYEASQVVEQRTLCWECSFLFNGCPMSGMTDFLEEPLKGHMIECIHFVPKAK